MGFISTGAGGGKGMDAAWISSSIFSTEAGGGKRMGAGRMAISAGGTVMNTIANKYGCHKRKPNPLTNQIE